MLRLTEIPLQFPKGERIHPSMGSIMHGALMELVGSNMAARLHEMSLRPYSQCVYYDAKRHEALWRLGTLSDVAYAYIVGSLEHCGGEIHLRQKGYTVGLGVVRNIQSYTYEELIREVFQVDKVPNGAELFFVTAASFKHNGQYEIFPDIRRVFYSALSRWNQFSPVLPMTQAGVEDMLAEAAYISRYSLESRSFSLERKQIQGFYGKVALRFGDNEMAARLMAVLLWFASFSGIGIKTALGMGAVNVKLLYK